ncbi:hypothetical protein XENTR_v10011539 [Xenopus tropicalis]|nr:hypothetical protein XENTR_v10011539 [Xenopus tropicalis]KAE8608585.1 hypothetical protein XENTR_v10011539 [Xenopus tropicalis]
MSLRYLLFSGAVDKLLKDHLWLSVWTRSPWSPFTRVQRLCCCMSLLLLSLLINIMFWKGDDSTQTGKFPINEIKISFQSSLILAVVNIIIVQMFLLIQKPLTQVKLPSNKLRVALSPHPPAKVDATKQFLMDFGKLVDFLHKYIIQILGETPKCPVTSSSEPILQHVESLSYLVQSYICVQGPNQENSTQRNVMTAHQCHFLHYLHQTLTKLQIQVSSLDLTFINTPIHYIHATNVFYELRDQLQSQHFSSSPLPSSVTNSFPVPVAKNTLSSRLPKFLPYVCWFVLLAISSFSAYYMTLVSLDMTRQKATSWLISMLLSLFHSLFLLPPVKAFIQTVFMFRVLRRSTMDDAAEEQQLHGILSLFANCPDWELSGCRDPQDPIYCSPVNKAITSLKRQKLIEKRLYRLVLEIAVHVVFLIMTMIMAYADKSPNEYNLNIAVSNSFSSTFSQIGNIEDFYSWTSSTLLPNLYSQYTGFITDGNCFLLGSPRIRQLRRAQSQYSIGDTGHYKAEWLPLGRNDTPDKEWKYYTEKELVGYPIWGQLGWYSGGGFVAELGNNIINASSILMWLQTNQWLDTYTKAVFVEFNVYNANVNLFCLATFIMETSAIGNFLTSVDLQIRKLSWSTTDIFSSQFISYIIFLIIVLYNIIQQGLLIKKQKWSYLTNIKNLLDLSIIMISICNTGLYIKLALLCQRDINRYQQDRTRFVSFYETAIGESIHGYSIAFLVSLMTAKLWSLLSLNPNLHLIMVTLRKAWDEIIYFLIAIIIIIVAYSITCNVLYGWKIYSYRTFFDTAVTIFSLLIGIFNYDQVLDLSPVIGSLLITTYVIFLVFVLVNIFLSAILAVFSKERQCPTPHKDKDVVDLLMLKLSGLFVIHKNTKRSDDATSEEKPM